MTKRFIALLVALLMAISVCPSALAKAERSASVKALERYNEHDYLALRAFFETEDENGIKNGDKFFNKVYEPDDPSTWLDVEWALVDTEYRVRYIEMNLFESADPAAGELDLSDFTRLDTLFISDIGLGGNLDVSGCGMLAYLYCDGNELTGIDLTGCGALEYLYCEDNDLTSLDFTGCVSLKHFRCTGNRINVLDMADTVTGIERIDGGAGYVSVDNLNSSNYISVCVPFGCTYNGWVDGNGDHYTDDMCFYSSVYADTPLNVTALIEWDTIPWNLHDFTMLRRVLAYETGIDVKGLGGMPNGYFANNYFDPDNVYTMMDYATWDEVDGEMRLVGLVIGQQNYEFVGPIDLSGCDALMFFGLIGQSTPQYNNVYPTDVNLSGCTGLVQLYIADVPVKSLDITGCSGLQALSVHNTAIKHLDFTGVGNLTPYEVNAEGFGSVGAYWEYCAHDDEEYDFNNIEFSADPLYGDDFVTPAWHFMVGGQEMTVDGTYFTALDSIDLVPAEVWAEAGIAPEDYPTEFTAVFDLESDPVPDGVNVEIVGEGEAQLAYDETLDELHIYIVPDDGEYCTGVYVNGDQFWGYPCFSPIVIYDFSEYLQENTKTASCTIEVDFSTLPTGLPIADPVVPEAPTGTFVLVTDINDITDGDYVLYGLNYDYVSADQVMNTYAGAMNSTVDYNKMGLTEVTVSGNTVVDPATEAVWTLAQQQDGSFTLYNAAANVYCMISIDNTSGFTTGEEATYGYTIEESGITGAYYMQTTMEENTRMISIFQNDFRAYKTSNWETLYLYKHVDTAPTAAYVVNFINWNGKVLKTEVVAPGGSATAPEDPTSTGYTFTGWDVDYTNVQSNLVVTAQYQQDATPEPTATPEPVEGTYELVTDVADITTGDYVIYGVNGDYTGAMNNTISNGHMGLTAVTVEGNTVVNPAAAVIWHFEQQQDGSFTLYNADANIYCMISANSTKGFSIGETATYGFNIFANENVENAFCVQTTMEGNTRMISIFTSDFRPYNTSDLKPLYLYKYVSGDTPVTHTVTFVDWDGTVLSTQTVNDGEAATAPADPVREGYTFIGWDTDFSNVTTDLTVTATYQQNPTGLLGDVDCDGDIDFDDVTLLNAYLLNAAELSEQGLINANVNGDNKVSSADVVALNKLILGSN